jgi:hypothetical protein
MYLLKVVSDVSLEYHGVCYYFPCFVSDFANLGLFPPHFSQICQGPVNLVYFFKEPAFCFIDSLYGFLGLYFNDIFVLIFIISLLLLVLSFASCCFSRILRCSIRSFIWDLYVFLIYAFMAINFPLNTVFSVSHMFW